MDQGFSQEAMLGYYKGCRAMLSAFATAHRRGFTLRQAMGILAEWTENSLEDWRHEIEDKPEETRFHWNDFIIPEVPQ
jgi:hypothetical protein